MSGTNQTNHTSLPIGCWLSFAQQPLHGIALNLFVFRIPESGEQVAGRQVTDAAFAVIESPSSGEDKAPRLQQPVFGQTLPSRIRLGLFSSLRAAQRSNKVVDAAGDGMVAIYNFHAKGPDRRMLFCDGAEDVAKVAIVEAHKRSVVIEKHTASLRGEFFDGDALGFGYPGHRVSGPVRQGWFV